MKKLIRYIKKVLKNIKTLKNIVYDVLSQKGLTWYVFKEAVKKRKTLKIILYGILPQVSLFFLVYYLYEKYDPVLKKDNHPPKKG